LRGGKSFGKAGTEPKLKETLEKETGRGKGNAQLIEGKRGGLGSGLGGGESTGAESAAQGTVYSSENRPRRTKNSLRKNERRGGGTKKALVVPREYFWEKKKKGLGGNIWWPVGRGLL